VLESSTGEQNLFILVGDKNAVAGDPHQTKQQIHTAFSLATVKTQYIHIFILDGLNHLSHGRQT